MGLFDRKKSGGSNSEPKRTPPPDRSQRDHDMRQNQREWEREKARKGDFVFPVQPEK